MAYMHHSAPPPAPTCDSMFASYPGATAAPGARSAGGVRTASNSSAVITNYGQGWSYQRSDNLAPSCGTGVPALGTYYHQQQCGIDYPPANPPPLISAAPTAAAAMSNLVGTAVAPLVAQQQQAPSTMAVVKSELDSCDMLKQQHNHPHQGKQQAVDQQQQQQQQNDKQKKKKRRRECSPVTSTRLKKMRRRKANDRERNRMHGLNDALEELRSVPAYVCFTSPLSATSALHHRALFFPVVATAGKCCRRTRTRRR